MPDYEIRLFRHDGSLALVHMSAHANDEDAQAHAKTLVRGEHARCEVRVHDAPES